MKIRIGTGTGVGAGVGVGGEGFLGIVDACERIGWDSLWFSERVAGDLFDPLAAMGVAIGRTQKLKFGTSVLVLPGRNPVLLAKELASLDVLSGGRIVAVFGLGSPVPAEHELFGVDRRQRAAMTDEAVELIVRLWTSDDVTFEGRFYSVHGASVGPKPVQEPHIDVWFGGHSDAACRRVGRLGTGWLPSFIAASEYKAKIDLINRTAAEHDREIEDDHFGGLIPYVPPGAEEHSEPIMQAVSARRKDVDPREVISIGGDDALRERLEAFVEQGGSKFVVLPVVPPADWGEELQRVYDNVVAPLEN